VNEISDFRGATNGEGNCSPSFTAASSQCLKEATVVPSPCEAIIPAGSKAILIITDDINHLHSRINEEGHYVMARSNISDIESQPSKTGSANISYSLGQEKEIVDQWINTTTGPPGFGPLSQEKEGVSQQPTATGFGDGFNLIHGGSCEDIQFWR
jgi:hypothetical protein